MYAVTKLWKGKEKGATGYIEVNRKINSLYLYLLLILSLISHEYE